MMQSGFNCVSIDVDFVVGGDLLQLRCVVSGLRDGGREILLIFLP